MEHRILVVCTTCLFLVEAIDGALHCDAAHNRFQCKDKHCVALSVKCDFKSDCKDGSDELDCDHAACDNTTEFTCKNKKCVYNSWLCDGNDDCFDGSDESLDQCSEDECISGKFQCRSGDCIPDSYKCDGDTDCDDGDDEDDCPPVECKSNEVRCPDNSECILRSYKCDGEEDCDDGSDEEGCTGITCEDGQFACASLTQCIESTWRCNGLSDCEDGSDEEDCEDGTDKRALKGYFSCSQSILVIPMDWVCNGNADCPGGSDELHCDNIKHNCPNGDRLCANRRQCVSGIKWCDGARDCIDKSDESECPVDSRQVSSCPHTTYFQCPGEGGKCIEDHRLCDNTLDCDGGEDEKKGPHFCDFDECGEAYQGNCSHTCVNRRLGYECGCPPGMELGPDRLICQDINECVTLDNPCDFHCFNTEGSYKCMCDHGYMLVKGKHCKPLNATYDVKLLIADTNKVEIITMDKGPIVKPLVTGTSVQSVAVDIRNDYFYWSDVKAETISRAKISNPKETEIILDKDVLKSPRSLAIDWIHGLLFWVDTHHDTLSVVSLSDLEHPKTLHEFTEMMLIAIAVLPESGSIYMGYPARSGIDSGLIERCGMDGDRSSCVPIVTERISYPTDIAIDYDQGILYWVDSKLGILVASNLNGKQRRDILIETHTPFSVAVFSGRVYFTDSRHHQLLSTNRTGGELRIVKKKLGSEADAVIMNLGAQPSGASDFCDGNTCDMMCLPQAASIKPAIRKHSCVCPDHFTKSGDGSCISSAEVLTTTAQNEETTARSKAAPRPTTASTVMEEATTLQSSSEPKAAGSNAHVIIIIGVIGLVVLIGVILWVVIRRRRQRASRMSMNFNNPIYKKVNESVASSSSFPGLTDPSPTTSSGDVSNNEGTAGLMENEEPPDIRDRTQPMVTGVKFTSEGRYAKVPNGDADMHFLGNHVEKR